MINITSESDI
jgi:hypothetical protein